MIHSVKFQSLIHSLTCSDLNLDLNSSTKTKNRQVGTTSIVFRTIISLKSFSSLTSLRLTKLDQVNEKLLNSILGELVFVPVIKCSFNGITLEWYFELVRHKLEPTFATMSGFFAWPTGHFRRLLESILINCVCHFATLFLLNIDTIRVPINIATILTEC